MNDLYFYIFEFGAIFAILAIFIKERKNKNLIETLVLAILYGVILEVLNVYMSGTYSYGEEFLLQIYDVPLTIGLGWAVIYYISYKSTQNYNLKWWQAPFFMSLFALSIDLVIDIIAIRLGFWHWLIPFNQEWFGVPYDNLFGWMAVIWTFAFFINFSEQSFFSAKLLKIVKYSTVLIAPFVLAFQIISYTILAAVASGKFTLNEVIILYNKYDYSYAYYPEVQIAKAYILFSLVILLILYLTKELYKNRNKIIAEVNFLPFLILILLHLFFFVSVFTEEIYKQLPIAVFISVFIFTFHFLLHSFPVYIIKKRKRRCKNWH
ncbi:carotenoid biosynthesis protein [Patescibacteria group bacterium]|nr:carotenoid biosynthesis protein [Patescibacteria group bacterium]